MSLRHDERAFTVALIGPDGTGKTTIARRLERELTLPVAYVYMSINPASASHMLPTTRLGWWLCGRPDHIEDLDRSHRWRITGMVAGAAELTNRVAEEWYRQLVARRHLRGGRIVLFDRHYYYDYYATDIAAAHRRKVERLHGYLLERYPRPDLTIYLDAPPEVLLARKGEGTLESLATLRRELLGVVRTAPDSVVLDAARPLDEVVAEVARCILGFAAERGLRPAVSPPAPHPS